MNVASHRQRARRISPFNAVRGERSDGTTFEAIHEGAVNIDSTSAPEFVKPGSQFVLEVRIFGHDVGPFGGCTLNPVDCCGSIATGTGWRVETNVQFAGVDRTGSHCVKFNGLESMDFELLAPEEEGDYEIPVRVFGGDSQNLVDQTTHLITVDERADPPPPNGNGDGWIDGPLLPCFADPNRQCAGPETVGWVVAGTLLLVAVLN